MSSLDGNDDHGMRLDVVEWILIVTLSAILIVFVGIPVAALWWAGDIVRKKLQKNESATCPDKSGCVINSKREDRECPY